MRKVLLVVATALGVWALAYLFDPDRGRSRRARISDQMGAAARDAARRAESQFEYQKGVAEGVAHEVSSAFRTDDSDYNDATIEQKVRSEALGPLGLANSVEVDISDGTITIRGSVPSEDDRDRLLDEVSKIAGERAVEDHVAVG